MPPDPLSCPVLIEGIYGGEWVPPHLPPEICPEAWILANPQSFVEEKQVQVALGAQVLFAPTGWLNPFQLSRYQQEEQLVALNEGVVALTRGCATDSVAVFAAIGSIPLTLRPFGSHRFEELVTLYGEQVAVLAPLVDGFSLEGIATMAELRAAVLAIRQVSQKPIWVTVVCDDHGRLEGGSDLLATLIVLEGMGISAFGLAEGEEFQEMVEQLARIAPYATIPLLARVRGTVGEDTVLDATDVAKRVARLAPLGVRIVGSWKGTTQAHMEGVKNGIAIMATQGKVTFPTDPDVIPCASETEARFITPDIEVGEPLECTPDLMEDIVWAEEESPQGALKIAIYEEDDIDLLAETQYAIRDPLCIETHAPDLLEGALRVFQGRAFWDGMGEIELEFLEQMQHKYGLILL